MSAHISINFLEELGKRDKMHDFAEHFILLIYSKTQEHKC